MTGDRDADRCLAVTINALSYCTTELLRNGREVEIRALQPKDRGDLIAAVDGMSAQSLYRRFFGAKRAFTEEEILFFVNVDFVSHVALVAVTEEGGRPVIAGGARYVVSMPGQAELAFAVVDQYQGQGVGTVLMRHLITIARDADLDELFAVVLPDNTAMLKVFEKSGLPVAKRREGQNVHVTIRLS